MPEHACVCTQSNTVGGSTHKVGLQTAHAKKRRLHHQLGDVRLRSLQVSLSLRWCGKWTVNGVHLLSTLFLALEAPTTTILQAFLLQHPSCTAMFGLDPMGQLNT